MNRRIGHGLVFKMSLAVLAGTLLVFSLVMGFTYGNTRQHLLNQAKENALRLADSMANRLEQEFRAMAKVPENLVGVLEVSPWDSQTLLRLLSVAVERNKEIYGAAAAFEPYAYTPNLKAYAPYFYKSESGPAYADLATNEYNYFEWDWYNLPKELWSSVWSEPYYDEGGGNILMATYSVPLFETKPDGSRHVKGIVTADVSLAWLKDLISSLHVSRHGFAFLISGTGTLITYPEENMAMRESIFSMAEDAGEPQLRTLGREMIQKPAGFVRLETSLTDKPAYIAYCSIPSTGWSLAVALPEDELLEELNRYNRRAGLLGIGGLILLILVVVFISRSITGPLRRIAQATTKVADGDLDLDLSDIRSRDEVGQLAQAFTHMTEDLKKYIRDLTRTTAAKERIESELSIAAQIQSSILPTIFPPFPDHNEFDLYALMRPAREVGGDFYDFFFIDQDRLALVIADVSGKGVPAALFMMISRTVLKSVISQGMSPAEALAQANDLISQNNEATMFVTVFLAYYQISSGRLIYANAGHLTAIILDGQGGCREFGLQKGVALGVIPDLSYAEDEETLGVGESLVLYTDGVTEACSPQGEMYGQERFTQFLGDHRELSPESLCQMMENELVEFQVDQQFDDITLLDLKRTL